MSAVGTWLVPCAPYGRREGVASSLGLEWPPRVRGRFPGPRTTAVGACTFPWAPYGRREGVVGFLGPYGCPSAWPVHWAPYHPRGGVAGPLGLV